MSLDERVTAPERRRCAGCSAHLAADNTAALCSKCHRETRDQLRTPPIPSDEFWATDDFRAAFESQHIGRVLRAYRNHPRHLHIFGKALNQELLGRWLSITQAQVSKLESGKPEQNLDVLRSYAQILHLPQHFLWFDLPGGTRLSSRHSSVNASALVVAPFENQEADRLAAQILDSETADEAINQLAFAANSLADSHTRAPAKLVLAQVLRLHEKSQLLLEHRQRLSQKRELYRIESNLLAHACLLLDDLKLNNVAQKYGSIALSYSEEAGTDQATARTALAKALRWDEHLIESADMARIGYECSPQTPIRIQLASQEANAAALMGDIERAHDALRRSELAAEEIHADDGGMSAWSFPVARQAIFALSVAVESGDPDAALRAVARADESWQSGSYLVQANWAQIRVGSSIAHILKGSLDVAIDEVKPVLALPPELRISTVTAYIDKLDRRLRVPQFRGNADVTDLREAIQSFNSLALQDGQPEE